MNGNVRADMLRNSTMQNTPMLAMGNPAFMQNPPPMGQQPMSMPANMNQPMGMLNPGNVPLPNNQQTSRMMMQACCLLMPFHWGCLSTQSRTRLRRAPSQNQMNLNVAAVSGGTPVNPANDAIHAQQFQQLHIQHGPQQQVGPRPGGKSRHATADGSSQVVRCTWLASCHHRRVVYWAQYRRVVYLAQYRAPTSTAFSSRNAAYVESPGASKHQHELGAAM